MSTEIESLELQIISNSSEAVGAINKLSSTLGKLRGAISQSTNVNNAHAKSYVNLYAKFKVWSTALKTGIGLFNKFTRESLSYIETMNLVNVTMGEYADEAKKYAEEVEAALGIDPKDWLTGHSALMSLVKGFGVANDRAYLMSKNLNQIAYDLWSLKGEAMNFTEIESLQKVQSAIAGELEPLRRVGFDLSNARLELEAYNLGIDKKLANMTQAEKAELRYMAIIRQSSEVMQDMSRTLNSPANQLRILRAQVKQAARAIGNIFIPVLNKVVPVLTAVTKVLRELVNTIAKLLKVELPEVDFDEGGEGANNIAQGMGEAADNAKKLKNYTAGFDELNVLSASDSGASDESLLGGGFTFDLPEYDFINNATLGRVNEIVEKIKEWLGLTKEITSWSDLMHTNFGKILKVVEWIGLALVSWQIANGITYFVNNFGVIMSSLGMFLKLAGGTAVIIAAVEGATWLINNTEDTVTKIGGIISGAALAVGAILAFTGANIPLGIGLMVAGAVSMGSAIALNTNALSDDIKNTIAIITSTVSVGLLAVGAILAFSGVNMPLGIALMAGGAITLCTSIAPNWGKLSKEVQNTILSIMTILGSALLVIGAILAFTGVGTALGMGLMFAGAASLCTAANLNWDYMKNFLKGALSGILAVIGGSLMVIGVLLLLSGAGIGLGLALIAAGIGSSFAAWKLDDNPVTRFVKKMANGIINLVNVVIEAINKMFHIKFDGLVIAGIEVIPSFNVKLLNLPKIPTFAEGGFPEQGQMFIAREAGAEMVGSIGRRTAVANNDQIVAGIASGVASANTESNTLLREQNELLRAMLAKESGVYLDGKKITQNVEKHQRERGRVLVTGGAY